MKSLIVFAALVLSSQTFATEITCRGVKAVQSGFDNMKVDAVIKFDLNKSKNKISNIEGHIFVQNPYAETHEEISTENSYMGFFKLASVEANADYRPLVYKGFTQFKKFDATYTTGQEDGMWGALVLDLEAGSKFEAKYVFQAGDHMGGTVLFNCRSN